MLNWSSFETIIFWPQAGRLRQLGGVTANIVTGNSFSIKGEVYFGFGSEVSLRNINSTCFTGGRFANANNNQQLLPDSNNTAQSDQVIENKENDSPPDIIVATNPFEDEVTIFAINTNKSYSISVFNPLGKLILEDRSYSPKTSLSLIHLPKGIYLLKIANSEFTLDKKLIKN